jgi:hypothetical protein
LATEIGLQSPRLKFLGVYFAQPKLQGDWLEGLQEVAGSEEEGVRVQAQFWVFCHQKKDCFDYLLCVGGVLKVKWQEELLAVLVM